jgi:hypothetical protein
MQAAEAASTSKQKGRKKQSIRREYIASTRLQATSI